MTNITLLLPDLEAGGAERVMLTIARELVVRGHQVSLVLFRATGPLLTLIPRGVQLVDLGVHTYGFGNLGFAISSIVRLKRWLKQAHPDVVLSTITGTNLVALLARKLAHLPIKIVIREAVTLKNVRGKLRLYAMRWLYPQADSVVVLTNVMANEIVTKLGVTRLKVHCIPNPIDVDFIYSQSLIPIQHHWLDDDNLKIIIAVGRLATQKDFPTLLAAFSMLQHDPSVRLIIIGEGPERKKLEHIADKLGISKHILLLGFESNPWRWMSRANLFVLSSIWEGYPNVILEAIALGLPVVVSEYDSSIHDLFIDIPNYPRRIVTAGEPEQMYIAIKDMLANSQKISESNLQQRNSYSLNEYESLLIQA